MLVITIWQTRRNFYLSGLMLYFLQTVLETKQVLLSCIHRVHGHLCHIPLGSTLLRCSSLEAKLQQSEMYRDSFHWGRGAFDPLAWGGAFDHFTNYCYEKERKKVMDTAVTISLVD